MIAVTKQAKALLHDVERPEEKILRLDPLVPGRAADETLIGVSFGDPEGGDQVVEHEGRDLLRIAKPVSEALDGSTVELMETPEGSGLGIRPPVREHG